MAKGKRKRHWHKAEPGFSSLDRKVKGNYIGGQIVNRVLGPSNSPATTRSVSFKDGTVKRVSKGVLIDSYLVSLGYDPKYSDKDVSYFEAPDETEKKTPKESGENGEGE